MSHLSHNYSESNRTSSFFSSVGIGIQLQDGFCEVPSTTKDEIGSIGFTGKLAGLDSSDAGYTTPNVTFAFPSHNLFPGVDKKLDNATIKSLGSKRSKKRNGKLRQKTMVQKLFGQDSPSEEGSSQLNQNSPGCGSPMDFSPYQDTTADAPDADNGTGLKAEFAANENDIPEHCEKSHDDKSNSNLSPLTGQDGLSALDAKGAATHEVCEHWRIRGNQAYHAGKLSKAEEFYSMGISSFPHVSTVGYTMKPLLLCYSNRAATRMSLGRMREAIGDCTKAAELDPNFLKVALRVGNCYLVLGEVEDAIQCYTKCLSLGIGVCLDRRVTIEAADGVQKAKRVAEYMHQAAELLQEGTEDAAKGALANIAEALSISRYSERLLKMKGQALCTLRLYDEVIQLCEQTLDIAKKNFGTDNLDDSSCKSSHVMWRWKLQTKSHYHMGKLDLALDLIEKQEKLPISSKFGDVTEESTIALAATIRELLSLKKSGNEAFNSGRYTEAIENYTAAISKSFESRPFMAICFCNRAAAYQSVSQILDAIADCSLAIALDENYQKAISRRATLHEMIRDYKQAIYDLQRLISLLESQSQTNAQEYNSQSRSGGGSVRDLRKARRRLSLIEEKAKKETPLDLYLILGVKASDAESEIKKAYRKAALRHHPDKAGQVLVRSDIGDDGALWKEVGEKIHKDADRLFKIIGEAYAVLSDPSKRSKYDSEEEMRNIYRDSNRNSNSGHASTSYSSPYERGSWSGRQAGFSTPFERNSSRRYWNDSRSYSNFHSRW
ncbi:UNVERIFIED_CONTAM: DnaJsubfamily C member 7 [Sesamum latifolium]|uniref:DnaJsubfamily C member 7 n=1 Tax=Sesamum latifolium TaxID=2727402 RepID=A0AAW2XG53_9LAMI